MEQLTAAGVIQTPTPADLARDFVAKRGLAGLDLLFRKIERIERALQMIAADHPDILTLLNEPDDESLYPLYRNRLAQTVEQSTSALAATLVSGEADG